MSGSGLGVQVMLTPDGSSTAITSVGATGGFATVTVWVIVG